VQEAAFEICQRLAEAQALLQDHVECGRHSAAEVVMQLRALLEERALLQAMYELAISRRTRRCRARYELTSKKVRTCCGHAF
jgi:hypothetical protein